MKCTLTLRDWVNSSFSGLDANTRRECNKKLKFFIHSARHTPAYKLGRWDGCISYFALNGNTYTNLLHEVLPIIVDAGYEVDIVDNREHTNYDFPEIDNDYPKKYMGEPLWPKGHPNEGEPVSLRDHQVTAIKSFLENEQSIGEIATGAGKSLITACLSHLVQDYGRSLLIVPNRDLVKQTEEDYLMCGLDVGVYYGGRKELNKKHTICTWQSLDKLIKAKDEESVLTLDRIRQDLSAIIVDEAHNARGASLTKLLGVVFADVPLRWGLTGTMPTDKHEAFGILATIGPVKYKLPAKDLMEKKILSKCHVHMMQLLDIAEYENYESEHSYLVKDTDHLMWLAEFLKKLSKEGNTLLLVGRVDTGRILEDMIPDFKFVSGETKSSDRKESYDEFKDKDNLILGATYGVAAVGINLPRIFNLVLLEPGKSLIRVIQSIGRGIRIAKDKDFVDVYDISSSCKFSRKHMRERQKTYKKVDYPFDLHKIDYLEEVEENNISVPKLN